MHASHHNEGPYAPNIDVDRRTLLKTTGIGLATGLMAASPPARAQNRSQDAMQIRAESFAQSHEPKPLPFNSSTLSLG